MNKNLRHSIFLLLLIGWFTAAFSQQVYLVHPNKIVFAPDDTSLWDEWKAQLIHARITAKQNTHYSDLAYREKNLNWGARCYNIYMLMLFDRRFYDAATDEFSIEKFMTYSLKEFGGFDGLVLWHAYPRIGFDDRNQFDFYRQFPGGLKGLRKIVNELHKKGIRVFIDYNPWDSGTRREDKNDIDLLVEMIRDTDADGIFLDTMKESSADFRNKLDAAKPGVILESELELPTERIADHHMSWAQWYQDSYVPGVLWNKWFERKHMMHSIKRWDNDHVSELHTAWMNGAGLILWDNIFGTPNTWSERDKSILRSMIPIQRRYYELFSGEGWNPLYKVKMKGVFANEWYNEKYRIWTIVNRNNEVGKGVLFKRKNDASIKYYDLVTGKEAGRADKDSIAIDISITAKGVAAIIAINKKDVNTDFLNFLTQQASVYTAYNNTATNEIISQSRIKVKPVVYGKEILPGQMVAIEETIHPALVKYKERECGFYEILNKTKPLSKDSNTFSQQAVVSLTSYAIDETPVTNQQFYEFIKATGYKPRNTDNFLLHWDNNKPPAGKEDHPVVYVTLNDARAYAKWAGKRLPTAEEWQYAAEGPEQLAYPWGNTFDEAKCNNGQHSGTTAVKQFENGRSAFGCYDMCGNTWEWTETAFNDGMTDFCIIKGGSYYKANGSMWYTDGGAQRNDFAAKFIFTNTGLDRCATIGFRCAVDIR